MLQNNKIIAVVCLSFLLSIFNTNVSFAQTAVCSSGQLFNVNTGAPCPGVVVVNGIASLATGDTASCLEIQSTRLSYGMNDAQTQGEISKLQAFLKENGYLSTSIATTGSFGARTRDAVKALQVDILNGVLSTNIDSTRITSVEDRQTLASTGFLLSNTGTVGVYTKAKIAFLSCGGDVADTIVSSSNGNSSVTSNTSTTNTNTQTSRSSLEGATTSQIVRGILISTTGEEVGYSCGDPSRNDYTSYTPVFGAVSIFKEPCKSQKGGKFWVTCPTGLAATLETSPSSYRLSTMAKKIIVGRASPINLDDLNGKYVMCHSENDPVFRGSSSVSSNTTSATVDLRNIRGVFKYDPIMWGNHPEAGHCRVSVGRSSCSPSFSFDFTNIPSNTIVDIKKVGITDVFYTSRVISGQTAISRQFSFSLPLGTHTLYPQFNDGYGRISSQTSMGLVVDISCDAGLTPNASGVCAVSSSTSTLVSPTISLSDFSPKVISTGGTSTISFTSKNADYCTGIGIWNGDLGGTHTNVQGATTPVMNTPGVFSQTVICTGLGGQEVRATASLTVVQSVVQPSLVSQGTLLSYDGRVVGYHCGDPSRNDYITYTPSYGPVSLYKEPCKSQKGGKFWVTCPAGLTSSVSAISPITIDEFNGRTITCISTVSVTLPETLNLSQSRTYYNQNKVEFDLTKPNWVSWGITNGTTTDDEIVFGQYHWRSHGRNEALQGLRSVSF